MFAIVKYEPLKYNKVYHYPAWGHMIGWSLALASILCVPIRAVYVVATAEGENWEEVRIVACFYYQIYILKSATYAATHMWNLVKVEPQHCKNFTSHFLPSSVRKRL